MTSTPSEAIATGEIHVFFVVGEESGDQLGAGLMRAIRRRASGAVRFSGVGGAAMAGEGLSSLFPPSDIALMGWLPILKQLPIVLARLHETVAAVLAADPDVLVVIDSPSFTHRVAKRVRRARSDIAIVNYVSPSVWAWKPWRAARMRKYIDHVLALLPFEPAAHKRLGGPACTYVGHPLIENLSALRPDSKEEARRRSEPPLVLILPGSRRGEITRLLPPFQQAIETVRARYGELELVLPTVPHLEAEVRTATSTWLTPPRVVADPAEKRRVFRNARAALAASGTVTLELALAGIPTVAAYKVAPLEAALLRRLVQVPSAILSNLVLGENAVPEFLQEDCTPERLAVALAAVLQDGPERQRQMEAFVKLGAIMQVGSPPSDTAAEIVLGLANGHRASAS